jgi:hypothetical protein
LQQEGIDEDEEYDDPDTMSIMQREAIKANKENRQSKSAHPKMRGKNQEYTRQPSVHDLTREQMAYGIRPSTAI